MEIGFSFLNLIVAALIVGGLIWLIVAMMRRSRRKMIRAEMQEIYGVTPPSTPESR